MIGAGADLFAPRQYAARKVFDFLGNPSCHENVVKVGAYILGEYGHLIADEPVRLKVLQSLFRPR